MPRVALITGASRADGLGVETARQLARKGWRVLLTARDGQAAKAHAAALGPSVEGHALDILNPASVDALRDHVADAFAKLDALINNAAIEYDMDQSALGADPARLRAAFDTNVLGPLAMARAFAPLLEAAKGGVVNVSSEAASFSAPFPMAARGPTLIGYTLSKTALNALTVKLAVELAERGVKVNAVCPGWIATYPGTAEMGARPVADGAASVIWAAELGPDGPTGGFFRDGRPLPW